MERIEVRSQAEFDVCVRAGNIAIVIGCRVVARENSSVVAWENSSVEAWGNSSVEAWENSSVVAWENSSVVASANVFVRLFSALKIKVTASVVIMIHGYGGPSIEGGNQINAVPEPKNDALGSEYCVFHGLDPAADYIIPNIDASLLKSIEDNKAAGTNGLEMGDWHGGKCDETNWCNTTHCRAGYAICLAGKAGFDLERKHGAEIAGRMIYAVSRPDKPLPDFFASNEVAMADIIANAKEDDNATS
jgi:hypothetical protein